MATESEAAAAGHVLVFPFPAQGHINCMLPLAMLLADAGLHVTFLDTDLNRRRLDRPADAARLRFRSVPDGLADDGERSADRFLEVSASLATAALPAFRRLVTTLRDHRPGGGGADEDAFPPLTCVIADGSMPFALDTAEEVGVAAVAFRTASASSYWAYFRIPALLASGEVPFPEECDLDEPVRGLPGMDSFLRRRDLPSFIRNARDADDAWLQFLSTASTHSRNMRALILNTSDLLEPAPLRHIRANMRDTFAIGPLHALLHSLCPSASPSAAASSLWREDRACMEWLDGQPDRSVVYASFGSFAVLSPAQFAEFLAGLVDSGHRFIWVVRPGMAASAGALGSLPGDVRPRARIVEWAPQRDVLRHRAVGCFLTHCGWNSTLESVVEGMPMLCWPFFADQQTNSRVVEAVWRAGLDMKDVCDRRVVARMVREVMGGEKAAEMRRAAAELAGVARSCVAAGGPSRKEFERLVRFITSLSQ